MYAYLEWVVNIRVHIKKFVCLFKWGVYKHGRQHMHVHLEGLTGRRGTVGAEREHFWYRHEEPYKKNP